MALLNPPVDQPFCFADVEAFDPAKDDCAACTSQKECEQQINEDAIKVEEKKPVSFLHSNDLPFSKAVSGVRTVTPSFAPASTPTFTTTPAPAYAPAPTYAPAPQPTSDWACPGVAPVDAVPRGNNEELWARVAKNIGVGALARALTEASLIAEDERRRPVGEWGRVDRKKNQ